MLIIERNKSIDPLVRDTLSFCESERLADYRLNSSLINYVTITSYAGRRSSCFAKWRATQVANASNASADSIYGLGFVVDDCVTGIGHIPALLHKPVPQRPIIVGAVMCYTRQPKHIRKNTGGRDWLRANLRVRGEHSMRGLM